MNNFELLKLENYKNVSNGQYNDDFIKNNLCLKLDENEKKVVVCASKKCNDEILGVLQNIHFPKEIKIQKVNHKEFIEFLGANLNCENEILVNEKKSEFFIDEVSKESDLVNTINSIFIEAVRKNASDIHIQNSKENVLVRMRIDGVLLNVRTLSSNVYENLINRLKIMAKLNILEKRLAQDGHIKAVIENKNIEFRISFIPCVKGESVVLRLFNKNEEGIGLEELGFSSKNLDFIQNKKFANGLILVTGPTGSGKSTTLHSIINTLDKESLKIITVEDPVEKEISLVDQIQVNEEIGLSFNLVLRRILRQDPDVIMVGEIRDEQTCRLSVGGALTGHLIFSTLHTNDAISAITRLQDFGIEDYLISSVVRYVIAQRLVRKICTCGENLSKEKVCEIEEKYKCKNINVKQAVGCEKCNFTGYYGRTVVSEIFEYDEDYMKFLSAKDLERIRENERKKGMVTLAQDGLEKVFQGITTFEELRREGIIS